MKRLPTWSVYREDQNMIQRYGDCLDSLERFVKGSDAPICAIRADRKSCFGHDNPIQRN
jgi:hypothetical protein